jgi:hypothetical protein
MAAASRCNMNHSVHRVRCDLEAVAGEMVQGMGDATEEGYDMNASREGKTLAATLLCGLVMLLQMALAAPALSDSASDGDGHAPACDVDRITAQDGVRRIALVVGVGTYLNPAVRELPGATQDAQRFAALLTHPDGYGFPAGNVCLLLDAEATTARFREAFDEFLVGGVRGGDDIAVVYFAMHGSQVPDLNGDEPDEWDETLMFHDARVGGTWDLVDDELNGLLASLHGRTRNVTVIMDSCNSGSATRRPDAATTIARFQPPPEGALPPPSPQGTGDGGEGWVPASLPGIVIMSASTDGNPAMERQGEGIFTKALLQVLSRVGAEPLTYAQLARQVPPLVNAESPQVPLFHGDLGRPVFGNTARKRPVAWEVTAVGETVELGGVPLPGIGVGAELRIYDGAATAAETRNPAAAKARVVVTGMRGLNATARQPYAEPRPIGVGDLAVLERPADRYLRLSVRIRPAAEPGGVPPERAARLRDRVAADDEAAMLVDLTDGAGDFEISVDAHASLVLRGPENRVRNVYDDDASVPRSLWQHARQRALLYLNGEGGDDFTDNRTLAVQLVPAPITRQPPCADGIWDQAEPNREQLVPLCHAYNVRVTHTGDRQSKPLLIGALLLSTDGSVYVLPADGRKVLLEPGDSVTFEDLNETFMGTPPLDVQDRVIVFGTQQTNPVPWDLLAQTAQARSASAAAVGQGPLFRTLDRYFKPGTRGIGVYVDVPEDETTWTASHLSMRVLANSRFLSAGDDPDAPILAREYTIPRFDIRPYLPDDTGSALYRLLVKADELATSSIDDGYDYRQHDWSQGSDAANLAKGIDCSRAVWYAFTRSGLPYNRSDAYLTTAMMVQPDTWMDDRFQRCDDDPNLRIGDVLVYRDDTRGDGHVVMVIDPGERIAWGSHGWDGNPRILPVEPDTGVEYQLIKYKQDWQRWDRSTMERKACWRHEALIEDRLIGRGEPGPRALQGVCMPGSCG